MGRLIDTSRVRSGLQDFRKKANELHGDLVERRKKVKLMLNQKFEVKVFDGRMYMRFTSEADKAKYLLRKRALLAGMKE